MRAVLITGSRHWQDGQPIVDAIMSVDPNLIIEGGAEGADRWAREYATKTGTARLTWPDDHWMTSQPAALSARSADLDVRIHAATAA